MKEKDVFKKVLLLVVAILLLVLVIFYTEKIGIFFGWLISHTKVVLIGIAIAFVINIPTKFFERILTPKNEKENKDKKEKSKEDIVKEEKKQKRLFKGRRILSLRKY